jgi:hypothetical protein
MSELALSIKFIVSTLIDVMQAATDSQFRIGGRTPSLIRSMYADERQLSLFMYDIADAREPKVAESAIPSEQSEMTAHRCPSSADNGLVQFHFHRSGPLAPGANAYGWAGDG